MSEDWDAKAVYAKGLAHGRAAERARIVAGLRHRAAGLRMLRSEGAKVIAETLEDVATLIEVNALGNDA